MSHAFRRAPVEEHPVGDRSRETHRLRTEGRDPDRGRPFGDEGEPERLALGRHGRLTGERPAEHRDGRPKSVEGVVDRRARPETQDQPSVRPLLDRRSGLRQQSRRARGEGQDAAAEQELTGFPGDPGERREDIARTNLRHEHRAIRERLADPSEAGQVTPLVGIAERERGAGGPGDGRHMLGW